MLSRHRVALVLVAWTFLVWTTRIANIWGDDALDTADKLGRTALALSFTLLAAAVLVNLWRGVRASASAALAALCGWTTAVWLVRSVAIALGDHSAGFKVVHVVLAVVSIALAVLAWREAAPLRTVRSARPGDRSGDEPGVRPSPGAHPAGGRPPGGSGRELTG